MPYKSEKQKKYLWANEPEVAKKFEKHTPKGKKLADKVKNGRKSKNTAKKMVKKR